MKKFIYTASFLVFLSACTTVERQSGAELRQVKLDQITPTSVKGDVINLLGSPSTKSAYGQETWYYITSNIKKQLIRDDKVINQSVVAISFNQDDMVDNVEIYDKNSRREFASSERVTPTAGRQLNMVEQILGNVGKFNTDNGTGSSQIGSHAPSGGRGPY
jgi:outer membrane protein assembly factor BamE (lipoprotein component of BamABCDE complex)